MWSNPDMIACYVTPADAVVDKFARNFIQHYTLRQMDISEEVILVELSYYLMH